MGHTDLNMTKRYLALTNQDLLREHQFASPINFLVENVFGKLEIIHCGT